MPPKRKPAPKKAVAPVATLSGLIDSDAESAKSDHEPVVKPKKRASVKKAAPAAAAPEKKASALRGRRAKKAAPVPEVSEEEADDEKDEAPPPPPRRKGKVTTLARKLPAKGAKSKKVPVPEPEPESESEQEDDEEGIDELQQEPVVPVKKGRTAPKKKVSALPPPPPPPPPAPAPAPAAVKKKVKKPAPPPPPPVDEIAETQEFDVMDVDEPEVPPSLPQTIAPVRGKGNAKPSLPVQQNDEEGEEDELAAPPLPVARKPLSIPIGQVFAERKAGRIEALEKFKLRTDKENESRAEKLILELKANHAKLQKSSNDVIQSLQDDLNAQAALVAESKGVRKQLIVKEEQIRKLEAKIKDLNKQVSDYQKENQVLQGKVQAAQLSAKNVPGSAMKPSHAAAAAKKAAIVPEADWVTRAKDQLYSDLTNLLIINVKSDGPSARIFDCIQTGANDIALNFKLHVTDSVVVPPSKRNGAAAAAAEQEENDYVFIPQLEDGRDSYVASLLPDYLRGEISFSRQHAARFYQKINTVLMKPPVPEDSDSNDGEDDGMTTVYTEATAWEGETEMQDD